jgi:mannose-6-phosphate isomerase-like protein (cupin superfamily)
MNGLYFEDIEKLTKENTFYRKVISTNQHLQLVLMSLKPNEEIGMEVHNTLDQFFRIEDGEGKGIVNGNEVLLKDGSVLIVPAGSEHNIINTSKDKHLKLYSIYAPPNHHPNRVDDNKPLHDGGCRNYKLKKYY